MLQLFQMQISINTKRMPGKGNYGYVDILEGSINVSVASFSSFDGTNSAVFSFILANKNATALTDPIKVNVVSWVLPESI